MYLFIHTFIYIYPSIGKNILQYIVSSPYISSVAFCRGKVSEIYLAIAVAVTPFQGKILPLSSCLPCIPPFLVPPVHSTFSRASRAFHLFSCLPCIPPFLVPPVHSTFSRASRAFHLSSCILPRLTQCALAQQKGCPILWPKLVFEQTFLKVSGELLFTLLRHLFVPDTNFCAFLKCKIELQLPSSVPFAGQFPVLSLSNFVCSLSGELSKIFVFADVSRNVDFWGLNLSCASPGNNIVFFFFFFCLHI